MKQYTLQTENLTIGYDEKNIVEDMNLTLPEGKVSIILGANGCGKSTLLKSLSRLLSPREGKVTLNGQSLSSYRSKLLAQKIGLLPQSPVVPEGITVTDLVARGRFPYQKLMQGLQESDFEIIQQALETMGISDLANRSVDELSGGQRQRVWIALALAQDTDILLLDEPTTYLDVAYQVEILDVLKHLNQTKGTTICMVLHDINLSARYADYIFAMKKGKLVAQGNPKDIITPELMEQVYGLQCTIIEDPLSHTPLVVPKSKCV